MSATALTLRDITLRALEPTDLDALFMWENDTTLWEASGTSEPLSRKLLWQYLEAYDGNIATTGALRLMVCLSSTGAAIGTIDLFNYSALNQRAELGVMIDPMHRGKGLGQLAITAATKYAHNWLNLHTIYATCFSDNTPAIEAFKACGYQTSATLPAWFRRGSDFVPATILIHQ